MNKIVSFLVSKEYSNSKLDDIISKSDISINESIINYGVLIYECANTLEGAKLQDASKLLHLEENIILKNDCKRLQDQIQVLNNSISALTNEKHNDITSFIERGKQIIKEEYQIISNIQLENNKKLEIDLQKAQLQIQELTNKLISNNGISSDKIDSGINQLNQKFTSYFDKIFSNNTAKGDYGEDFVQNYLIDKFSGSLIIDTHKETAKGDILFEFNKLKMLIEIKNVQTVKPTEIEKFYRDIEMQKDSINSALFISLNDTNIMQGKKNIHFEIKYNIPIFMITNAFNQPENIRLSIIIIEYLIKHQFIFDQMGDVSIPDNSSQLQLLITAINEIYDYVQMQKNTLDCDNTLIQKLQENLKKRENQIINIDIIINNIFKQYPQLHISNKKESEKSENEIQKSAHMKSIIDKILKYLTENNIIKFNYSNINNKFLKQISISDNDIRNAKGIKQIQKEFQLCYKLTI
uniref:Uncharacterized protein n=1 Tax=viral metagenome TaxID=1070528 RepID=A0A6C0I200_9ZZZZ